MKLENFVILAHINYMKQQMRQRAIQNWVLSLHYSSCAYSLLLIFFTLKQCNNCGNFTFDKNLSVFCYLVVFISTLLFCKNLFYCILLLKYHCSLLFKCKVVSFNFGLSLCIGDIVLVLVVYVFPTCNFSSFWVVHFASVILVSVLCVMR